MTSMYRPTPDSEWVEVREWPAIRADIEAALAKEESRRHPRPRVLLDLGVQLSLCEQGERIRRLEEWRYGAGGQ